MDSNLIVDAELRAITAESMTESLAQELKSCKEKCDSLQASVHTLTVDNAVLKAKLETERAERERSDGLIRQMLVQKEELIPEWDFKILRDGANKMISVTAAPRSK